MRLVHAASLIHDDAPDEAVDVATAVIETAGPLKSERYLRYIRDLQADLMPFANTATVQAFNLLVSDKYPRPTAKLD